MMAAILNSAMLVSDTVILDSDTWLSSLRFMAKTLFLPLWLWLKLIQSDSILMLTWWWRPSWILPSWIQLDSVFGMEFRHLVFFSQIHSKPFSLHSDSDSNSIWLKLIHFTYLDDGGHLELCNLEFGHLGISHLSFSSQTHSHLQDWFPPFEQKKPSLIHSHWTWWWHGHLEFCKLGFRHCHVKFRHLVIFSQIHSKTLSLHSDSDSN